MNRSVNHTGLAAARACLALLAVAASGAAGAAPADDGERSRIAHERADIEAHYAERVRACSERFVVTSCVEDAKRDRRRGLDALRARQLKLDEESRRARAAARRAELAAKAAEDVRREQERAARAASAPAPRAPRSLEPRRDTAPESARSAHEPRDRPRSAAERLGIKPARRGDPEERKAREERSRAAYEARQREAAEHRQEVMENLRKRAEKGPAAAPLPVPGASAAR